MLKRLEIQLTPEAHFTNRAPVGCAVRREFSAVAPEGWFVRLLRWLAA